jgi:hypothetical protein
MALDTTLSIPLTRGLSALVDASDYAAVMAAGPWQTNPDHGRRPYAQRNVRASGRHTTQSLHTFLTGWPLVDHINGDGLDNRRVNLREATRAENNRNRGLNRNNRSGYKGVAPTKSGRWSARIKAHGTDRSLGTFATAEAAARAYDDAARELFGEFARPNLSEATR